MSNFEELNIYRKEFISYFLIFKDKISNLDELDLERIWFFIGKLISIF